MPMGKIGWRKGEHRGGGEEILLSLTPLVKILARG